MVERSNHGAFRQDCRSLLGSRSFNNSKGKRALFIEAEWIHAINDDAACEVVAKCHQGVRMTVPRHRHDHNIGLARRGGVVRSTHSMSQLPGDRRCALAVT